MRSTLVALSLLGLAACATEKVAVRDVAQAELMVESLPAGATVFEGATERAQTPWFLRTSTPSARFELLLRHPGFHDERVVVEGAEVLKHSGERLVIPLRPATWPVEGKRLRPEETVLLVKAGTELSKGGRCAEALQYYRFVADVEPQNASAYRGMGICYAKEGKRAASLDAYKRYIALAPDAKDAKQVQEMVSRAEGDISVPASPNKP